MNKFNISAIAVAIGLAFSFSAMAQTMSKDDYKSRMDTIAADHKSARADCNAFSANAKDICLAGAKGREKVAKAELEASYKPTQKNTYDARVARAEADYTIAREKCDDHAGNVKDVCVKEAKAAQTTAKANAQAQMKTADANKVANEKTTDAQKTANDKSAVARKEAAADKRDADYAVAKEKCDAFASDAKDICITNAKARYGKS